MSRDFDLGDILTITTGALVSPRHVDGIYDILGYMTGDVLFTHQLPRAADACRGPLLEQHPQLAGISAPSSWDTATMDLKETVAAWLRRMKDEHGDTLPVSPLDAWHHMDPLQELAEMTETPDRIVVVRADGAS